MPVNTTETHAAVLAEMRKAVVPMICGRPKIEAVSIRDVLLWADRIEAAVKRERAPCNAAAKWLYRLEYHDGTCGLWYDGSGNWCFERGIGSLDDSCKTKSLPMDYDERYRQDGRSWFSSCSRKEDLLHWYSREDAKRLLSHGFVFTRYLATEYREYDQQTVFIKETCLYREEIDFESLWKSSTPGNSAALREALDDAHRMIEAFLATVGDRGLRSEFIEMRHRIDAALAAPPEPPFNASALRDALLRARNTLVLYSRDMKKRYQDEVGFMIDRCDTALAAPARNCDRTKDEAESVFKAKFGRPWTAAEDELATWLFAEDTSFRDAAVKQANKLANELRNLLD